MTPARRRVRAAVPAAVLAGVLGALGCGSAPPPEPVPIAGTPADLAAMAGEWSGEYWSADTGRSGRIDFRLDADAAAAWGDVTMFPAVHEPGTGVPAADPGGEPHGAQPLTIRFVRVADGQVSGTLDPYHDPACGCMVSTTFTGTMTAGRIEGTYVARGPAGHHTTSGKWQVERVPAS